MLPVSFCRRARAELRQLDSESASDVRESIHQFLQRASLRWSVCCSASARVADRRPRPLRYRSNSSCERGQVRCRALNHRGAQASRNDSRPSMPETGDGPERVQMLDIETRSRVLSEEPREFDDFRHHCVGLGGHLRPVREPRFATKSMAGASPSPALSFGSLVQQVLVALCGLGLLLATL